MFARSAAPDTLQGRAIQAANVRWGDHDHLQRSGRESIGFPVCKKKYAPFCFPITENNDETTTTTTTTTGGGGGEEAVARVINVERMYGCRIHHELRKAVIEKHGERDGWESFGQWSLQKAKEMAKRETLRMRKQQQQQHRAAIADNNSSSSSTTTTSASCSSSSDEEGETDQIDEEEEEDSSDASSSSVCTRMTLDRKKTALMCMNGTCAWKVKSAYDDIYYEINGHTESEAEDNVES